MEGFENGIDSNVESKVLLYIFVSTIYFDDYIISLYKHTLGMSTRIVYVSEINNITLFK